MPPELVEVVKALGPLGVFAWIVWKEMRGLRAEMRRAAETHQEILVKALTGELRSYSEWKASKPEPYV